MLQLSFGQQLALTVIDKVALGGIIAVVGYLANRKLETYKAREGLRGEAAKQRLAAIGEVWHAIGEYEDLAYRGISRMMVAILEEWREAGVDLPAILPRDAQQALEVLEQIGKTSWPPESTDRLQPLLKDIASSVHAKSDEVGKLLQAKRFWLGSDLNAAAQKYRRAINRAYKEATPRPDALASFRVALLELEKQREDASKALERILGGWA